MEQSRFAVAKLDRICPSRTGRPGPTREWYGQALQVDQEAQDRTTHDMLQQSRQVRVKKDVEGLGGQVGQDRTGQVMSSQIRHAM